MWQYSQSSIKQRFEANLSFLQKSMPDLFKVLRDVRFQRLTLSVNEPKQTWDIFDQNRSLYLGDAEHYIREEVDNFCQSFPEDAPINTINPIKRDDYSAPRFFHRHLSQTMARMDFSQIDAKFHHLPETMPILVFSGVGSGVHIQEVLNRKDANVVLIMETDPEALLMSMYMTDWYKIIPNFTREQGRFFNFILINEPNEDKIFKGFWNELVRYVPLFPSLNVFYNHLKSAFHDRIIKRIQAEFRVFITAWGFYDDEANQLNNALHNLRNLMPTLPTQLEPATLHWANQNPAVVVGAGPSLNDRIDWIKANRDRFFLFSAGTALSVLKHHGIVPDLHVEIESDYSTVSHLSHTLDEDYQIPLLAGAVQLNPRVFTLTRKGFLYFKDSTALHAMFGQSCSAQLQGMTPTCTNAATGLATQLGFRNVFLFGMDFGYRSKEETHATGSVYFDKKAPKFLQDSIAQRSSHLKVPSIDGDDLITEPIYNSARDRVEKLISSLVSQYRVFNCSTGAQINGTEVLRTREDFESRLGGPVNAEAYRDALLSETVLISPSEIDSGVHQAESFLKGVCDLMSAELARMPLNRTGLIIALLNMSRALEDHYRKTRTSLYFLVRGTLWHYFNAGVSVAFATVNADQIESHIRIWRDRLTEFLNAWPEHFHWVANRDVPLETDTWLEKRISEPVDDPYFQDLLEHPFRTEADG